MKSRSNAMIIMGIVTLVAVLAVTMLLGVPFWASLAISRQVPAELDRSSRLAQCSGRGVW